MDAYPAHRAELPRPPLGLALIALMALGLSACEPRAEEPAFREGTGAFGQVVPVEGSGTYVDLLPQELLPMLQAKDFFFVNVHVPYEGEIPETDAFIPYDQVQALLDQFPPDRAAKIVLYCRSGSMSAIAARELVRLGYTRVYNLDEGFRAWAAAGYEFIPPR